jgi:hypothetical protein
MLHMCVCMHSRFIKNHPIWVMEDGLLISKVVLTHIPNSSTKNTNNKIIFINNKISQNNPKNHTIPFP